MEEMRNGTYEPYDEGEIDLFQLISDMAKHFRRLWWLCVLLVLLGAAAVSGVLFFSRTPMYQSSASFTVATGEDTGSYGFYYDSSTADQLSMTFPYILESSYFRSVLLERLGTSSVNGTITAETISGSNVVTMKVQSSSAQDAYAILTAAIEIYPDTARFVLGDISFSMLSQPQIPVEPYNRPSVEKSCLMGAGAGLLVSLGVLALLAIFRKNVCTRDEMKRITSMRCLAMLPRVHIKARTKKQATQIIFQNPSLPHSYTESIRILKNRVVKAMEQNGGKVLLVTSTASGEGKSVTAVNLAEQLARDGAQVLLVDGDLRKQGDGKLLGITAKYGLQEVAKTSDEDEIWERITQNSRGLEKSGLLFLGSGKPLAQPAAVLSSGGVKQGLQALREGVDYIVIDSPPCGMFQDAAILADCADSVLYLVGYDRLPSSAIREGIHAMVGKNISFLGYAFNSCPESSGTYGYGYGKYGYGRYGYGRYGVYGRSNDTPAKEDEREKQNV